MKTQRSFQEPVPVLIQPESSTCPSTVLDQSLTVPPLNMCKTDCCLVRCVQSEDSQRNNNRMNTIVLDSYNKDLIVTRL